MYPIHPLSFLENPSVNAGDEIIVPKRVFDQWLTTFPPGRPLLAKLTNLDTEVTCIVCIGGQDTENECIFAPDSVIEILQTTEEVLIDPYLEELPSATKLYLRLLNMDPIDGIDLRQAVETHLDTYHVLALGTTLKVPVQELGGCEVQFYVENCEPAAIVRLGGEVLLEILTNEVQQQEEEELIDAIAEETTNSVTAPAPTISHEEMRLARLKAFAHLITPSAP